MNTRRVRRGHAFKSLTKKERQKMTDSDIAYNRRWRSSNNNVQAILNYIHKKKYDIDGVSAVEKADFNKLMKPYRGTGLKKYIFVIPEDELNNALTNKYDLEKNRRRLEKSLKKAEHLNKTRKKPRYIRPVKII